MKVFGRKIDEPHKPNRPVKLSNSASIDPLTSACCGRFSVIYFANSNPLILLARALIAEVLSYENSVLNLDK
jgi:hypothetical protein